MTSSTRAADAAIERLMTLHPKGYDLSLDRIARLLDRLGNPHERMPPVIHIAGTNGKGSAAAFARAFVIAQDLSETGGFEAEGNLSRRDSRCQTL